MKTVGIFDRGWIITFQNDCPAARTLELILPSSTPYPSVLRGCSPLRIDAVGENLPAKIERFLAFHGHAQERDVFHGDDHVGAVSLSGGWGLQFADDDEGEDHVEDGGGLEDADGGEVGGEALAGLGLCVGGGGANARLQHGGDAEDEAGDDADDQQE